MAKPSKTLLAGLLIGALAALAHDAQVDDTQPENLNESGRELVSWLDTMQEQLGTKIFTALMKTLAAEAQRDPLALISTLRSNPYLSRPFEQNAASISGQNPAAG